MATEIERKFSASPETLCKIREKFTGAWQTIPMQTTYFDTPDGSLSARKWTLRLRLENGEKVCTLKTPGKDGARGEWECRENAIEDAIPVLCKLGCPEELPQLTANGLVTVCGAKFTRQALTVEILGCKAELALDEGILLGGGKQIPLCEVEAELKEGSTDALDAFALALSQEFGLTEEPKSKFRRALELAKGE